MTDEVTNTGATDTSVGAIAAATAGTNASTLDVGMQLQKSIATLTSEFGAFSDADLQALHDGETNGQKRTGMLKAIHSEQSARQQTANMREIKGLAEQMGVKIYTDDDIDTLRLEHGDRISTLEAALIQRDGVTPATAKDPSPRKLSLTGDADGPFGTIAFSDDDDMTLAELPELEFGPGAFDKDFARKRVVLTQPIVFPESARRTQVSKVWLLGTNGKAVAVAQLVNPLAVGGGTRATIPAGYLAFGEPEPEAAANEAV